MERSNTDNGTGGERVEDTERVHKATWMNKEAQTIAQISMFKYRTSD